jgi:hypothetical protein
MSIPDNAHDALAPEPKNVPNTTSTEEQLQLALRALGGEGDHLVRGLTTLIRSMPPILPRSVQSAHSKALVDAGVMTAEDMAAAEDELAQGALQLVEAGGWLASAWETVSLDAASAFLHRTPQDILKAAGRGELLMVEIGDERRIPTWQFTTRPVGHLLPHLAELVPALLERWQPLSIGRFFTTRQEDLLDAGMKTPAAWLEDGGDPAEVLDLISAGLYR